MHFYIFLSILLFFRFLLGYFDDFYIRFQKQRHGIFAEYPQCRCIIINIYVLIFKPIAAINHRYVIFSVGGFLGSSDYLRIDSKA